MRCSVYYRKPHKPVCKVTLEQCAVARTQGKGKATRPRVQCLLEGCEHGYQKGGVTKHIHHQAVLAVGR